MTGVLIDLRTNRIINIRKNGFSLLMLCDGETNLDAVPFTDADRALLSEYVHSGYVRLLDEPDPIQEFQRYRRYGNTLMESVMWSITGRCNCRCRHCYMDAPDALLGELSTEQCFSIIDQMADCGILRVELTGGEPLVRDDFWQIVDRMLEKHILLTTVYTNGLLLTEKTLDAFEQRGLKPQIRFSFDGIGWHDWMRGIAGAESKVTEAMKTCARKGFPFSAAMCLHKGNKEILRTTVNMLAEAGASSLKVSNVTMTPLWHEHADGNDMDIREYYEAALDYIPFFFQDGMPMNLMLCSVIDLRKGSTEYSCLPQRCEEPEKADEEFLCGAIRSCGYISPDGRMIPCMGMVGYDKLSLFPNILETGMKAALSDSFYMDYISSRIPDLLERNAECRDCPYVRECCAGCRANAVTGPDQDLWAPDRNACILWKEGYVDRIRQVTDQAIKNYVN